MTDRCLVRRKGCSRNTSFRPGLVLSSRRARGKPFRDWAVSRILLETLRAVNLRVSMPKLNVSKSGPTAASGRL